MRSTRARFDATEAAGTTANGGECGGSCRRRDKRPGDLVRRVMQTVGDGDVTWVAVTTMRSPSGQLRRAFGQRYSTAGKIQMRNGAVEDEREGGGKKGGGGGGQMVKPMVTVVEGEGVAEDEGEGSEILSDDDRGRCRSSSWIRISLEPAMLEVQTYFCALYPLRARRVVVLLLAGVAATVAQVAPDTRKQWH